jgi:metal-responsive CopG/Arc/MetJ family transcriptional regulator
MVKPFTLTVPSSAILDASSIPKKLHLFLDYDECLTLDRIVKRRSTTRQQILREAVQEYLAKNG